MYRLKDAKTTLGNAGWTWAHSAAGHSRLKKVTGMTAEDPEEVNYFVIITSVQSNLAKGRIADRRGTRIYFIRLVTHHGGKCTRPLRALSKRTMFSVHNGRMQAVIPELRYNRPAHAPRSKVPFS